MGSSLRITVLGSATPYPRPGNACSGYLLESGGGDEHGGRPVRVWVDAGSGTLGELQRYVGLGGLDAVWISHLHADHCADLLTAFYGLRHADVERPAPLPLFGPPGIADRLAGFLTNGPARSPVESAFAVEELYDGHAVRIGGIRLLSRAVEHGGLPAFGLRAEGTDGAGGVDGGGGADGAGGVDGAGGAVLAYSGDSGPCAALTELARESDLFLCEADGEGPGHLSPEQAGRAAAEAGAARLLVTHVGPAITPGAATARAAAVFPGPVSYAEPGLGLDVTRRSRTPGRTTPSPASSR
ncbi:MBL fold metallo-hydrolase [Streptomyces showdoensis]|uniref:Beta-lactamase n=1 Tax=Streptomyces showdoensis TaxID=68268 RepID=A0A2P2GTR9_STREW|nr:MBL fold metallo-hydrolase [Streptomyces showdoensis]KKZ74898.1 beta-lactamase [Streptomyces showdoensis]